MDLSRRELCLAGRLTDLPHIIDFIEHSARQAGVGPAACLDLQLAVEEACTNIMAHAYGGSAGDFEICFEAQDHDVRITVRDQGQPFNPHSVSQPDLTRPLEERQIGGMGLYLMEKLMDEVHFTFAVDGNTLVMIKRGIIPPGGQYSDA